MKSIIQNLYLHTRWYKAMMTGIALFVISFFIDPLFEAAVVYTILLLIVTGIDLILLFAPDKGLSGNRNIAERLSLGDENNVEITIQNNYGFKAYVTIIEELPEQLQIRDFVKNTSILPGEKNAINYSIKPTERGVYEFGHIVCFAQTTLRLARRRYKLGEHKTVKVYPSFAQLRKYQLMATQSYGGQGIKKVRRLGHSMEFEKIKSYVPGDDIRTINWKATARNNELMVNTYSDMRQQQVYCVIDKGRSMKMPFDGMTLLDYSINAVLAMMNIVLMKHDRAGLITFSNTMGDTVPADRRPGQLNYLLEALYKQDTDFQESSYETLWNYIHRGINQRSTLLLFTNFETMSSLERQLPYLKKIASRHMLCVVFYQNTLLKQIHESQPNTTEGIYIKTIADRFDYEKKLIVKELRRHGIISILTTPENLTPDVINKYLEIKARQFA